MGGNFRARKLARGARRMIKSTYIIAVKREQRRNAVPDWVESLRRIKGLKIRGQASPFRTQVEATPAAIEEIRHLLGDLCHIEPIIEHTVL